MERHPVLDCQPRTAITLIAGRKRRRFVVAKATQSRLALRGPKGGYYGLFQGSDGGLLLSYERGDGSIRHQSAIVLEPRSACSYKPDEAKARAQSFVWDRLRVALGDVSGVEAELASDTLLEAGHAVDRGDGLDLVLIAALRLEALEADLAAERKEHREVLDGVRTLVQSAPDHAVARIARSLSRSHRSNIVVPTSEARVR